MSRDSIVRTVRDRMRREHGNEDLGGLCLYWARAVVDELRSQGEYAILQAGSLSWPLVTPDDDDGVTATHFSYVWEPDSPVTRAMLNARLMPEMHVWAALPRRGHRGQIVDLTTCFLRGEAERRGLRWTAPPPPDYLWCGWTEMPPGVVYRVDKAATELALAMLKGGS